MARKSWGRSRLRAAPSATKQRLSARPAVPTGAASSSPITPYVTLSRILQEVSGRVDQGSRCAHGHAVHSDTSHL